MPIIVKIIIIGKITGSFCQSIKIKENTVQKKNCKLNFLALEGRLTNFFKKIGAPTVAVAAADGTRKEEEDSTGFWKKNGFEPIPARLMIKFDIQETLDEDL